MLTQLYILALFTKIEYYHPCFYISAQVHQQKMFGKQDTERNPI